jgi:FkbM family methyltransferase
VGANDGVFGDPLREHIVRHPWRGVLIEPQPDVFQKLKSNYAGFEDRIFFENIAISDDPAPISLYRLPASHTGGGDFAASVASFDRKTTARQLGVNPDQLEKIVVPTARLDDIIAKYHLDSLDILQLDTEGFDWHVLQTINLKKTRPLLIRFEHGHLSPKAIGEMTQHLNAHDYLVNFGGHESDSVAMRSDFVQ